MVNATYLMLGVDKDKKGPERNIMHYAAPRSLTAVIHLLNTRPVIPFNICCFSWISYVNSVSIGHGRH